MLPHLVLSVAYGEGKFLEAIPVMRLFGLIVMVRYMFEVPALMLTTSHRQIQRMILVILATIFNFFLNSYAIPAYGIVGAATVSLATNFAVGVGYAIASRSIFPQDWLSRERTIPLLVVVIGYLIAQRLPLFVGGIGSLVAACYIITVYFFGFTSVERIRLGQVLAGLRK